MKSLRIALTGLMLPWLAACGGTPSCNEAQFYKTAQPGQRIAVPDGLDELPADRELRIPEASERAARPENAGCIEAPPRLSSDTG